MSALLLAVVLVAVACGSGNGFGGEAATITPAVVSTQDGDLLRTVQDRGRLVCGVSGTRVIFSETQPDGSVVGVDDVLLGGRADQGAHHGARVWCTSRGVLHVPGCAAGSRQ